MGLAERKYPVDLRVAKDHVEAVIRATDGRPYNLKKQERPKNHVGNGALPLRFARKSALKKIGEK